MTLNYLVMGITKDAKLVNDGDVYEFEMFAYAKCLDSPVYEAVFDRDSHEVFSSWPNKYVRPSMADLQEVKAIIIPAQKTLFSTGYIGAQDEGTQKRITFLRLAKDMNIPIYYVVQSENAEYYNILHELNWLRPNVICRNLAKVSSNIGSVTSGFIYEYQWLQFLPLFMPIHYRITGYDMPFDCAVRKEALATLHVHDRKHNQSLWYRSILPSTRIPELSLVNVVYYYDDGTLESQIYAEIFKYITVYVETDPIHWREIADLRYVKPKIDNPLGNIETTEIKDRLCLT